MKTRSMPVLPILFLLAVLLPACRADQNPAGPIGIVPAGKPEKQARPEDAWAVLSACFRPKEGGGTEYPPDYAGAWIDGEKLHVALCPEAERGEDDPDCTSLLSGFGCVVFEEAEYPLNDLLRVQLRVFPRLCETFKVYEIGPDERENLLRLGADKSEDKEKIYDKIDEILEEEGLRTGVFKGIAARDLFIVEDGEPVRDAAFE